MAADPHHHHAHGHDHEHAHDHDPGSQRHHDHGHGGHGHAHGAHAHGERAGERRLTLALLILGTFTLVEALGGWFANSIALLAEAAHMLADSASLLLAILAIRIGRRPASVRRTYGHRRYQPLAAFVNGQLLLALTAWVVYEAVLRLLERPAVNGRLMLAIALIGGVANIGAFMALSGARSLNERGARAHVLSDLLGSVAASLAALVILVGGWPVADPLLSLAVSALIFRSAWALTRESAHVLLEGAPAGCDVEDVESALLGQVPGLIGVHHVHVWSITGEHPTVTLHANLATGSRPGEVIAAIHARLQERLRVEHTTVQIEDEGACDTPDCRPPAQRTGG
ncbi:MAG TPA: cation diffusion facilitator family transporter [Steroidobacteraceae bacterium]|nr:cation diffusion facilitator family transporter [Steroidobacteraceae bacterium]